MRSSLPVHGKWLAALIILGLPTAAQRAEAQSLFDTLFGSPKPVYQAPAGHAAANRLVAPGGFNGGRPIADHAVGRPHRGNDDDGRHSSKEHGRSGYHTVCVRLCDGYYWPVSFSAPRSKLYRDANVCSSSCNAEAKLFHYPTTGGQMQNAVDLSGRAYSRLPTAFKYRKTLVQGCSCKPEPWSQTEIDRHRVYGLNQGASPASDAAAGKSVADAVLPPSSPIESVLVSEAVEQASTREPGSEQEIQTAEASLPTAATPNKPGRSKAAGAAEPRSRARPRQSMPPVRSRAQPAPTSHGGLWAGGEAKYTWPGDPPARVQTRTTPART